MAIAKKPEGHRAEIDKFIAGASDRPTTQGKPENERRTPFLIRMPPDLLVKIDAAAKQRGLSRSAWFAMVATRALDDGDW